jgi:threonine/homoserine/homoserine lactone efflux protein
MQFDIWLTFVAAFVVLLLILGPTLLLILSYALLADRLRDIIARQSVLSLLTRFGGVMLIIMGVFSAASRRSTA